MTRTHKSAEPQLNSSPSKSHAKEGRPGSLYALLVLSQAHHASARTDSLRPSGGEPLAPAILENAQQTLGRDFAHVKIHRDAEAAAATSALGASALTRGSHVFFSEGAFAPESSDGASLLLHELAHVGQNKPSGSPHTSTALLSRPGDPLEAEAEAVAHAASTRPAGALTSQLPARMTDSAASDPAMLMRRRNDETEPDYARLCTDIMADLDAKQIRPRLIPALEQLPSSAHINKLLNAWNVLFPHTIFFKTIRERLSETDQAAVWERLTGQRVRRSSPLEASTTESYFSLRAKPGVSGPLLGTLAGKSLQVTVVGKATVEKDAWYEVQFEPSDYQVLLSPTPSQDESATEMMAKSRAWIIASQINIVVDYATFLSQIRTFEMINYHLPLKDRITKLRQMCHSKDLPFDTMIGTQSGSYYAEDRQDIYNFFQLLHDGQAVKVPSGDVVDMYHFLVGLDVYQLDRIDQQRIKLINFGISDSASTWAGDIGAAAADMLLHKASEYEKQTPGMTEEERLDYYYRTRAPEADLLGDLDAWATLERVNAEESGDTMASIIESVYGYAGTSSRALAKSRQLAIQNFVTRHGLSLVNKSIESEENVKVLAGYIYDFGRVWIYNRQMPKSFWLGSDFDKSALFGISEKMARRFIKWLDTIGRANKAF